MHTTEPSNANSFDPADLVARLRADEPQAWADLMRRHERLLIWTARRHRLSAHDAEDVVQLTWVRCLEHLDQLQHAERLGSWLVTICTRECIRLSTKKARELPNGQIEDLGRSAVTTAVPICGPVGQESTPAQVDDAMQRQWQARLLHQAVATLPPRERMLARLLLREEPPSYRQISREIGMPIGAIGPVRQRMLHRLHGILTRPLAGELALDRAAAR